MGPSSEFNPTAYENGNLLHPRFRASREVLGVAAVDTILPPRIEDESADSVETHRTPDVLEEATWRNFGHDAVELSGLVVREDAFVEDMSAPYEDDGFEADGTIFNRVHDPRYRENAAAVASLDARAA